jgi:hypothetical protein
MQEERNSSPDLGLGTTVLAGMGAIALVAVLFLLSPWNVSHIADKSAPRTTYVAAPLQSGEYGAGLELASLAGVRAMLRIGRRIGAEILEGHSPLYSRRNNKSQQIKAFWNLSH